VRVIALVGLSGVGKSTLLREAAHDVSLRHLQASELIKAELRAAASHSASSEDLRLGSVLDNQSLLISGFARATSDFPDLVVFDGHTIIDGANGLIEIPADVFAALQISHIVFLEGNPDQIVLQRRNDTTRSRPILSPEELAYQQRLAIAVAKRISQDLGVPLTMIGTWDPNVLRAVLRDEGGKPQR
jgi:adenylate kinase